MSVPPKGEELPSARTRQERAREFAQTIADVLKEELARGASIKTVMAWTGAGERTVKAWLADSNAPRAFQLECLIRSSEVVYERLMVRTGRKPVVNCEGLEALRGELIGLVEAIENALA
jgi:membrane protein required for beta-lactamase induction